MNLRLKFAVALVACSLIVAGAAAAVLFTLWSTLKPEQQALFAVGLADRAGLLVFLSTLVIAALGIMLHGVFQTYVVQPRRLAEETQLILTGNPAHRIVCAGPAEIEQLGAAINALAGRVEALQSDVDRRIAEAGSDLEQEKNRLAALMSELTESVIVCNTAGRILLYNQRAQQLLGSAASNHGAPEAPPLIGLGRSLFAIIDRNIVSHALDYIQHRLQQEDRHPVSEFITTTHGGGLIRAHMAPVIAAIAEDPDTADVSGFVLVLEDVRREFEIGNLRDRLLTSLTEGTRSSLANIRAAVENLVGYPQMDLSQRQQFLQIIAAEAEKLGIQLNRAASDHFKSDSPLATMLGRDLLSALQRSIEAKLGLVVTLGGSEQPIWLKVDSFMLVQAFTYLAGRLRDECGVRSVELHLEQTGDRPQFDMAWRGAMLAVETALAWESEPIIISSQQNMLTFDNIVERHGGESWYKVDAASETAYFRLLLPPAEREAVTGIASRVPSRPTFYDFDLFHQPGQSPALDQRLLSELAYTVFDTETTGLEPSKGDKIISIGAARIVNGRLLSDEVFDQLINPQRPLSAVSVRVHGITGKMLDGQPTIDRALPSFHRFCEDTVLVAHNAAFDMRFLQLQEAQTGLRFTHPVLDTLMLSAVLHPNQADHTLEAIAARFGVNVIGRHTALGDAIVTGEIFLKMLPLLKDKGIVSLGQAREAALKTPYARVQY
jgi:DNA polymerase-3 subunit epsilon